MSDSNWTCWLRSVSARVNFPVCILIPSLDQSRVSYRIHGLGGGGGGGGVWSYDPSIEDKLLKVHVLLKCAQIVQKK